MMKKNIKPSSTESQLKPSASRKKKKLALTHSESLGQNSVLSTIPWMLVNSVSDELLGTTFNSWWQASKKFRKDYKVVNKITFTNVGHSGGARGCWSSRRWPQPRARAAKGTAGRGRPRISAGFAAQVQSACAHLLRWSRKKKRLLCCYLMPQASIVLSGSFALLPE